MMRACVCSYERWLRNLYACMRVMLLMYSLEPPNTWRWMCACEVCQNECVYIIQKVDRTHVKHTNLFIYIFFLFILVGGCCCRWCLYSSSGFGIFLCVPFSMRYCSKRNFILFLNIKKMYIYLWWMRKRWRNVQRATIGRATSSLTKSEKKHDSQTHYKWTQTVPH